MALSYPNKLTVFLNGNGDPFAQYVLVHATASLGNARTISAGANVVITDGGPGGSLVIAAQNGAGPGPTFLSSTYLHVTGNYTARLLDDTLLFDTTHSLITASLPPASASTGKVYYLKDYIGSASVNPVCISPFGGDTIEQVSGSFNMQSPFASINILSDGGNWAIIG